MPSPALCVQLEFVNNVVIVVAAASAAAGVAHVARPLETSCGLALVNNYVSLGILVIYVIHFCTTYTNCI